MKNWERYLRWLGEHDIRDAPRPDEDGLFWRGHVSCLLPCFRVYSGTRPEPDDGWTREEWGWTRFMRADQALEFLSRYYPIASEQDRAAFVHALRTALRSWLVQVDFPLAAYWHLLERRVEAIRVYLPESGSDPKGLRWSRRPEVFPDAMRLPLPGLDPVHTPENARAGLSRYLSEGWEISDDGTLQSSSEPSPWGPSTSIIPWRLHDAPRRLMLGASLQARAVPLRESEPPATRSRPRCEWWPPGRNLRVAIRTMGGWNHEDAIVVSRSAAQKLAREAVIPVRVLIPSVAGYRLEVRATGDQVQRGEPLARGFIDLYALGWRRHEAEQLGAPDGWLEIALPGAESPADGQLEEEPKERALRTVRWRAALMFRIRSSAPLGIGDKLGTPHGIKGVVSRILDDHEMPDTPEGKAELVLSPVSIVRRGAMGQLREASGDSSCGPRDHGTIFVMRQPQDAPPRCRVRGPGPGTVRGQRYGEMEFWALMAHGAAAIARELLSIQRCTLSRDNCAPCPSHARAGLNWLAAEQAIHDEQDCRVLCTRALNRYIGLLGAKFENGVLVAPEYSDHCYLVKASDQSRKIKPARLGELQEAINHLEDASWFIRHGAAVALSLPQPVELDLPAAEADPKARFRFLDFPILPPWLRPSGRWWVHPLSQAYWNLLRAAGFGPADRLPEALVSCLRMAFDERLGAGAFLRRHVLGRRLTRSARAVIVPDPELRIDQIGIPRSVHDEIFRGLHEEQKELVLVHRNPTLHWRGLVALRPVRDSKDHPVFQMPLGLLRVMNADFDGDQVAVVALETEEALKEARNLLPGSSSMRVDPFRADRPMFPLLRELSEPKKEWELAQRTDLTQEEWCKEHQRLLRQILDSVDKDGGWGAIQSTIEAQRRLWEGLSENEWLKLAEAEMSSVYAVRLKGLFGGILRRQLYRQPFSCPDDFSRAVAALQAVTERLTQQALAVKSEARVAGLLLQQADAFFAAPDQHADFLGSLDDPTFGPLEPSRIVPALKPAGNPTGLLAWLARPSLDTLIELLVIPGANRPPERCDEDPRIVWFLTRKDPCRTAESQVP